MEIQSPSGDAQDLERLVAEREDEIRQLRLALDVLSPIDPSTGMLNRIGVIDAIQDALNWLARRNEAFAILAVEIPVLAVLYTSAADDHRRLHQHLEAVLAATLRKVDKVGHLDHMTYAVVLREFKMEGSPALLERLEALLQMESEWASNVATIPMLTLAIIRSGPFHQPGLLLEQVESLRGRATPGRPTIVEL